MAEFAPIPSARVNTATAVKLGFLSNWRKAKRRSRRRVCMTYWSVAWHSIFSQKDNKTLQTVSLSLKGRGEFFPRLQGVAFEGVEDHVGPEEIVARLVKFRVEPPAMLALPRPGQLFSKGRRRIGLVHLVPVRGPVRHVNRQDELGIGHHHRLSRGDGEHIVGSLAIQPDDACWYRDATNLLVIGRDKRLGVGAGIRNSRPKPGRDIKELGDSLSISSG